MRNRARAAATMAALASALVPGGCASDPGVGWSAETVYPTAVSTVAVPIAENDTYVRDLEFDLTGALVAEIEARTPYRVSTQSRADSILTVHIRKADLQRLSKSRLTGLAEEVLVAVTIDFEWRDLNVDEPLGHAGVVYRTAALRPLGADERAGGLGRIAVVRALARDVVDEMRASW